MLRLLLMVACLVASINCFAGSYVRVTGEGSTLIEAKNNAFRQAIQSKIGLVLLSEQESSINNLDTNDISIFSAGYVDDYKIISSNVTNTSVKITMDVLVAPSKLIDQTLNRGKVDEYIDGYKISDKLSSYRNQKSDGNKVLTSVLNTYPQNAYTVTTRPYRVLVDGNQTAVLEVPYKLIWNYDYISALSEALKINQDNNFKFLQKAPANVVIMSKNPKDYVLGVRNQYQFNDFSLVNRVKLFMTNDREVRIKLVLRSGDNTILYNSCWIPNSVIGRKSGFYSTGEPNDVLIFGNETEENTLRASIDKEHEWILQKTVSMQVSVVPHSKC